MKQVKASIRAKFKYLIREIKFQFGQVNVRYRGLIKNSMQPHALLAMSSVRMMQSKLLQEMQG